MKIYARRVPKGLIAADEASEEALSKIKVGKWVTLEVKQPRNVLHHRKYWALINLVFQNQDTYKSTDELHAALKVSAGICTPVPLANGQTAYIPGSISFDKMSQDEFATFYDRAVDLICQYFIPGMDNAELKAQVEGMINPQQQAAE